MRVGEAAAATVRTGSDVDYVGELRRILDAHGITVIDNEIDGIDDVSRPDQRSLTGNSRAQRPVDRRRVSFDDARYEETWLSEHSRLLNGGSPEKEPLQRNPVHGDLSHYTRRVRSTSSERDVPHSHPRVRYFQRSAPATGPGIKSHGRHDSSPFLDSSQTGLELDADAFLETSATRCSRHCLHVWHDAALVLRQKASQALATAITHDRRVLLRQALDQWRTAIRLRQQEQAEAALWAEREERAAQHYRLSTQGRVLSHWMHHVRDVRDAVEPARRHILRLRYFRRWKAIAVDNAAKAKIIIARKYLRRWHHLTQHRLLQHEQADAQHEESLVKALWRKWFWQYCEGRVDGWRQRRQQKVLLSIWQDKLQHFNGMSQAADAFRRQRLLRLVWSTVRQRSLVLFQLTLSAKQARDRRLKGGCVALLRKCAPLSSLQHTLELKLRLALERKAFTTWHICTQGSRQAASIIHKTTLQSAWTAWNNALRIRTLSQRIDERLLLESLYRWVLEERLRLFQRALAVRIQRQWLRASCARATEMRGALNDRLVVFAEDQSRKRISSAVQRLHFAVRRREDAERAAVEFANGRLLPKIFDTWKRKTEHARQLAKWGSDAEFYVFTKKRLLLWREKTTQSIQERRRQAYVQVRTRTKARIVRTALTTWRSQAASISAMKEEAERRKAAQDLSRATRALSSWRRHTSDRVQLDQQAAELNATRLARVAISALTARWATLADMEQTADAFRRDYDLAIQASVLKRLRFSAFAILRLGESGEAFARRLDEQHLRQMLRHWATSALEQRTSQPVAQPQQLPEPESPSLRPATRAAARSGSTRRSGGSPGTAPPRPASTAAGTPAYLRTPARGRRARFRPISTPAPYTPFAITPAYLATTPLPPPPQTVPDGSPAPAAEGVNAQITPFAPKLRVGGVVAADVGTADDLWSSTFERSVGPGATGTAKSVRFARAGGRFSKGRHGGKAGGGHGER